MKDFSSLSKSLETKSRILPTAKEHHEKHSSGSEEKNVTEEERKKIINILNLFETTSHKQRRCRT